MGGIPSATTLSGGATAALSDDDLALESSVVCARPAQGPSAIMNRNRTTGTTWEWLLCWGDFFTSFSNRTKQMRSKVRDCREKLQLMRVFSVCWFFGLEVVGQEVFGLKIF